MGLCCLMVLSGVPGCEPKTTETPPAETYTRSLSVPFQSRQWDTPFGQGQIITTRHYFIHTSVRDSTLLAILPGFMEAAYRNYSDILRWEVTLDGHLPMYMLASRGEWEAMTIHRFGDSGPARMIENGGYTYKGVTVCWAIRGTGSLSVASHEGMHQLLHYTLKNRLPLWAEEGLATTSEGFVLDRGTVRFTPDQNLMRLSDLRNAIINDTWLDVPTLLTTNTISIAREGKQAKTVGYYGQLYALMCFLRHDETYSPRWRTMLQAARDGTFDDVLTPGQMKLPGAYYTRFLGRKLFEHYITDDLEVFEAEFLRYARRLVQLPPGS